MEQRDMGERDRGETWERDRNETWETLSAVSRVHTVYRFDPKR